MFSGTETRLQSPWELHVRGAELDLNLAANRQICVHFYSIIFTEQTQGECMI